MVMKMLRGRSPDPKGTTSEFPDFFQMKTIPSTPADGTAKPLYHHQSRGVPSLLRPPDPFHIPKKLPAGKVRKWRICSKADSPNTRVGPKGRGRLPVVPSQPRWRLAALTSSPALTLRPPLCFQAPPVWIPATALWALTSTCVC